MENALFSVQCTGVSEWPNILHLGDLVVCFSCFAVRFEQFSDLGDVAVGCTQ